MARKGGTKKLSNNPTGSTKQLTLREQATGKINGSPNVKSLLKLDHLRKLSVWASAGEGSIPSLGAFFGRQFAAAREALGSPPDPSLFPCQRCETILQPGFNCTVRVEKAGAKARRGQKKANPPLQNNVVYKCSFCSHPNVKRGTPKGHMKEICPPKVKPAAKQLSKPVLQKCSNMDNGVSSKGNITQMEEMASPVVSKDTSIANSPATPSVRSLTLLDVKKRKRNRSASKKPDVSCSISASTVVPSAPSGSHKRRRKPGTSPGKTVENDQHEKRLTPNLSIPFCL